VLPTLGRVGLTAIAGGLLVLALLQLPFPELLVAVAALAVGGIATLPFIWPEVKTLIKL
jgi:hydrogenase/urease accessory protein HupE